MLNSSQMDDNDGLGSLYQELCTLVRQKKKYEAFISSAPGMVQDLEQKIRDIDKFIAPDDSLKLVDFAEWATRKKIAYKHNKARSKLLKEKILIRSTQDQYFGLLPAIKNKIELLMVYNPGLVHYIKKKHKEKSKVMPVPDLMPSGPSVEIAKENKTAQKEAGNGTYVSHPGKQAPYKPEKKKEKPTVYRLLTGMKSFYDRKLAVLEKRTSDLETIVSTYRADESSNPKNDYFWAGNLKDIEKFVSYRNEYQRYGLKRIADEAGVGWINSKDDAAMVLRYAMNNGFALNRYDNNLAPVGMKDEMIKEYCTNYSKSLKDITESLAKKYNMKVSESTIRRYARQRFGSNISRMDRSAMAAFQKNNKKYIQ